MSEPQDTTRPLTDWPNDRCAECNTTDTEELIPGTEHHPPLCRECVDIWYPRLCPCGAPQSECEGCDV